MKLYDGGRVPNARRVRMFLAEKGITVVRVPVDLGAKEHLSDAFLGINSSGRVPVLELADGSFLTESIAICRYFEALQPEPPLFGTSPVEQALVEMWNRKVEFEFFGHVTACFRHLHPAMATYEVPQVKEWGEACRPKAIAGAEMLDARLAQVPWLAGENFSMADISAFIAVDFMKAAKLAVPENLTALLAWQARIAARPSATA